MALAAALLPGFQYEVLSGPFEGEIVTIVDNNVFPPGHEHQRKIIVRDPLGGEFYMLPRLLADQPTGLPTAPSTTVIAPIAAQAPIVNVMVRDDDNVVTDIVAVPQAQPVLDMRRGTQFIDPITDPMDARLDHLRPSIASVRRYKNRQMANGQTDVDFLLTFANDEYRNENDGRPANLMLKGDTQSGKTILVHALAVEWAKKMGLPKPMPIFTLSGSSGITDYDLFGQTTSYTDPETGIEMLVFLPGMADLAAQCGGILYLDEVNAMGERVTSSLHPMADSRHMFVNRNKAVFKNGQFMPDVVSTHMDLWIIGTFNEGYRGMGDMNEAFINRFRTVRWGYDQAVEQLLVHSAAIRLLGDALRTSRAKNAIRTPIGTAALQRLERDVNTFGPVVALEVLCGTFKSNEVDVVQSIIEDRSIIVLLNEELRQRRIEDRNRGVAD